jgi:hypothetical protein
MNGHLLPAEIRLPTTGGDFRLFRLEQGVLTLEPGRRFTLYFRYYHQLVQRGARPTPTPVLSESETGTYKVEGNNLLLTPRRTERARPRIPCAATLAGDEIRAGYTLMNGTGPHQVTLVLRHDTNFW